MVLRRIELRFFLRQRNVLSHWTTGPSSNLICTKYKNLFKPTKIKTFTMKLPKTTKRFCPVCKKKTEQKIKIVGTGFTRGSLTRGSKQRAKLRGLGRGIGNKGKWGSKPPQTKFKRKSKTTKKTNIMYTCKECNKSKYQKKGIRLSKQIQE